MPRRSLLPPVALLYLILAMHSPARAQQAAKPYTLNQVRTLVEGGVATARVLELVGERCRSFRLTPDVKTELSEAGATEKLIEGLEDTCTVGLNRVPHPQPAPAADTVERTEPEDGESRIAEDSAQVFASIGYVRGRSSGAFYGAAGETATDAASHGARLAVTGRGSGWGLSLGLDLSRYPDVASAPGATDEVGLFLRIERHLAPRAVVHPFVAAQANIGEIVFRDVSTTGGTTIGTSDVRSVRTWGLAGGAGLAVNVSNGTRLQLGGEIGRTALSEETRNIDGFVSAESWTLLRGVAVLRLKL